VGANTHFTKKHSTLKPNYPNPFSSATRIPFSLTASSDVRLELCGATGNLAWSKVMRNLQQGEYTVTLRAPDLPSGTYLCVLRTATGTSSRWVTIAR
jgi:hypothetical protein